MPTPLIGDQRPFRHLPVGFFPRVAWLACFLVLCAQPSGAGAVPAVPALAAPSAVMAQTDGAAASDPETRSLEERRPKTFGQWLARNVLLVVLALGLGAAGLGVVVLSSRKRK